MWVLKLETGYQNTVLAKLAKENKISFTGFPMHYFLKKGSLHVQISGLIHKNENIDKFIKESKSLFEKLYINKYFVIALLKVPSWLSVLYNPEIIFIQPAIYSEDGKEILELASFEKEPLIKLLSVFKKKYDSRIIFFIKKDISNINIISMHPEMTEKQKAAITIAVEKGYYSFPKKITLKKLAEIMGVSFSTYQAHLSKAESHFLPAMIKSL